MSDIPIFSDKARYSINEQLNVLAHYNNATPHNPFIVGHLNHSHIEPSDFLQFAQNHASVLINYSGITLHNLAARNSINKLAVRPVLLWAYHADKSQQYLLGEEVEAAVTGSDGIIYSSNDLLRSNITESDELITSLANKFSRCRVEGLSSIVALDDLNHLPIFLDLEHKPTAIFTFDDPELSMATSTAIKTTGSSIFHVQLNTILQSTDLSYNYKSIIIENINLLSMQKENLSKTQSHSSNRSSISTITSLTSAPPSTDNSPLVKVCGIKTVEAAQKALESGADMIGMILVSGRSRTVDFHEAKKISDLVHNYNRNSSSLPTPNTPSRRLSVITSTTSLFQKAAHLTNSSSKDSNSSNNNNSSSNNTNNNNSSGNSPTSSSSPSSIFNSTNSGGQQLSRRGSSQALLPPWPSLSTIPSGSSLFQLNSQIVRAKTRRKPAVVGVFLNQPLETILSLQHELNLDYVQLHGNEPLEWCRIIPVPVIKRFTPNTEEFANCSLVGYHYIALLDGEVGGEGKLVDWSATKSQVSVGARFILAGGLTEHNVANALQTNGVFGVDVSGGVETAGNKDLGKIERFVKAAKSVDASC